MKLLIVAQTPEVCSMAWIGSFWSKPRLSQIAEPASSEELIWKFNGVPVELQMSKNSSQNGIDLAVLAEIAFGEALGPIRHDDALDPKIEDAARFLVHEILVPIGQGGHAMDAAVGFCHALGARIIELRG